MQKDSIELKAKKDSLELKAENTSWSLRYNIELTVLATVINFELKQSRYLLQEEEIGFGECRSMST